MRAAIVLAIACARPVAPPANRTAPPAASACPMWTFGGPGGAAIAHEVFAACPPMPVTYELPCTADCPKPCREHVDSATAHLTMRHSYDASGRWLGWTREAGGGGITGERCVREGDAIESCTETLDGGSEDTTAIERDATGRPIALHTRDMPTYRFDRDERGRVVAQSGGTAARFRYDARDRLVAQDFERETIEFSYDASGRLATRTARGDVTRLSYDDRGRLVLVQGDRDASSFGYDARGRLVHVHQIWRDGAESDDVTFDYDCR
jgi:YD repeat-containing protein